MRPANIGNQRILAEIKKLSNQKLAYLYARPLPDDLYTWHFTFQGPENTQFHQGLYHGQILLPFQYPFKPPDIVFMNKNGRFQTNTKICLTITQYHPQEWNSAWTIRTMLEAVISLFAQNIQGVGSLSSSPDIRRFLAKNSHSYVCEKCGAIKDILSPRGPLQAKVKTQEINKYQALAQQLPRKQSEATNQVELPIQTRLFSQRIDSMDEKKKKGGRDKDKSSFRQQQAQIREHEPYHKFEKEVVNNRPQIQYRDKVPSFHKVILLSGESNQARKQLKYKENLKKIYANFNHLQNVFKTIKWF